MASTTEAPSLQEQLDTLKLAFEENAAVMAHNLDAFFLIIVAIMIYFMQAGFAFLECGCVRSKNATNILLKNILDSFLGCFSYWLIGFPLAFGKGGNSFLGNSYWASHDLDPNEYPFFFFHFVFAATAATIVSGAMAERCEFYAYIAYSTFITGFVYPIVTHWAWSSDGWLAKGITIDYEGEEVAIAYRDFAGSGCVHLLGGVAALVGAFFLGPRIGRFEKGVKVVIDIKGHSVPLTAFGGFILVFGFFAFNAGSQASISKEGDAAAIGVACVSTIVAASAGGISCMIVNNVIIYFTHDSSKWSLLTTLNGALIGMVSVCAGCNVYHPWCSAVIGALAGVLYLASSRVMLKLRIDDPLDAVAVHGTGGLFGVICTPIFAKEDSIIFSANKVAAVSLGWNIVGALAITAWAFVTSVIVFGLLYYLGVLRVDPTIEVNGLDIPKHGEPAYPLESYGDGWSKTDENSDKPNQSDVLKMKKNGFVNTAALFRMADAKTRNQFFPELLDDIKNNTDEKAVRKRLKEAFDETDTDKSGELDYDELKVMLHKAGFKANDNMMKKIIKAVDADKNGTIDFEEFIDFFMNLGPKIQTALRLQTQFEEIDKKKSGVISKKQLKKALKKEGNLSEWEIIEFVEAADKDGDGQISLDEWLEAMIDDAEDQRTTKALIYQKDDHVVVDVPNGKVASSHL